MISKMLNWIIGLSIGAVALAAFVNYLVPPGPNAGIYGPTSQVNFSTCKNVVARPYKYYAGLEVSNGNDCMD